jgi:hypothetical protein
MVKEELTEPVREPVERVVLLHISQSRVNNKEKMGAKEKNSLDEA